MNAFRTPEERFASLPGELERIAGAAHFLQEDRPAEIVAAMFAAFGSPLGS